MLFASIDFYAQPAPVLWWSTDWTLNGPVGASEWFAEAARLLLPGEPIFNDEFTEFGKWMDGWESRRKRVAGHDWCIIK